ncbi:unnamed protein product [Urochloa decumbens]|uniref:Uncharacterized protein n=1 Tax=Urochloa decumbens TaxID=240449 RepID=A0ABC9GJ51_9POAL
MQLDDADAGDVGKEKDARPPCGMTRDDSGRRQWEKDDDDALGGALAEFRGGAPAADDADALLGATLLFTPPAAGSPAADGDAGHHVESDAEARNVTRWDRDASSGAAALLRLALLVSFVMAGGGGSGLFLERLGRRKHEHLRTPPPAAGSVAPLATLGRRGDDGGRALLLCRGSVVRGARGTFSLAEAIVGAY